MAWRREQELSGPLDGLKVLEMAGLGPCPLAGQFLADLGASVTVIVRRSGEPDPTDINNRSKRSVALNLKTAPGVEIALRLARQSDILIEGFRPGVMERMGLGPEACHAINPGLIYGRMTGWGQEGPLSQSAGHDINYLAITGFLNAIGDPARPPLPPLNIAADYAGGTMFLLLGVLAALYERQTSGKGQVIDAAMVDGVPALMALMYRFLARGEMSLERGSNLLDGGAPFYRTYETLDGKYISVGPLEPQFFSELVRLAELPQDVCAIPTDRSSWTAMHETCSRIFRMKSRDEWTGILAGTDACFAPVLDWFEAPDHPQLTSRQTLIRIDGVMQAAPAPRFSRTPPGSPSPAPAPGGDTQTVLMEAGLSAAEIADYKARGILT